jgi:hypothetical protein
MKGHQDPLWEGDKGSPAANYLVPGEFDVASDTDLATYGRFLAKS